jgi:hypothetical protein
VNNPEPFDRKTGEMIYIQPQPDVGEENECFNFLF